MRNDSNPSLSHRPVKDGRIQRILYKSLTSFTSFTPLHDLLRLQSNHDVNECKRSESEANSNLAVNEVNDVDISQVLGMSINEAVNLWRSEGAPIIHLGPGENCEDLDRQLNHSEILDRHLDVVKEWLDKHIVTMSRS